MSQFSFEDYMASMYGTKAPVNIDHTKSLTSFHLFPSLPAELQLHVFSLAAENHTLERFQFAHKLRDLDTSNVYESFFRWTSINFWHPEPRTRKRSGIRNPRGEVYQRRNVLMRTCRAARQMALEAWVRDIKALDREWVDTVLVGMGRMPDMWERIGAVLEMLEGLVRETRGGRGE